MRKILALFILASNLCVLGGCGGGTTTPQATHFSVTVSSATATAGTAINITVSALDASGAILSSYSGTVHFASTDNQAVLPPNSALTSGTGTFPVTLKTAGSQTITAADASVPSITGISGSISVNPGAASQLAVSSSSATPIAGTSFNVTVSALDASNNTVTSYSGSVHFTSSDPRAVLPTDSPLTKGTGTFSVTFKTAGGQTITASDAAHVLTAGTSSSISVGPAAPTKLSVIVPPAATTGLAITATVNALDAFANVAASYSGTVHLTSSDAQAVLPANSTLTNGTGSFSVTLKTLGSQTITATDTVTSAMLGTSSAINVVTNAATHFSVTSPATASTRATFGFTVNALDAANNVSTIYSGTVHFSSTDAQAMLPANSTLAPGTAKFSATLETAGNQTVTATDTVSASIAGSSSSINVTASPALAINPGTPPNGRVGVDYSPTSVCTWIRFFGGWRLVCRPCVPSASCAPLPVCSIAHISPCKQLHSGFTFTATGGVPPYQWSATGMPPGLSVNPTNGEILGTPTTPNASPYNITVSVTDSGIPPVSPPVSANYQITIALPPVPIVNTTPAPPPGVENLPYTFTFSASGYPPLTWSESGALPAGLSPLSSAGVLAGTPTQTGSFPITVTATDQFNQTSTAANFTIVVSLHGFQATGSMATARRFHTATLLGNGKVLVAGGEDAGSTAFATTELFDPTTGTFTPTGNMTVPRAGHTATLLNSGKVLITGGASLGGNAALSSAELYDPSTGTFASTSGSMAALRVAHTATLLKDGRVLVAGGDLIFFDGIPNANLQSLSSAELFDPNTGSFTAAGSMTTARETHTATLLNDGRVLVAGGSDGALGNSAEAPATVYVSAELFDPATGKFTATGSMTVARDFLTATLLNNGKVLIAGGVNPTAFLAAADLFDPTSGSFTATGNMADVRFYHDATLLSDGTVLVTGGSVANTRSLASAELFDPTGGSFAVTGSMIQARVWHTATLLKDGRVLVTGGAGADSVPVATAELYH